jgi:predicted regulator of Ras-like GTPase activity (Roadblock/LC7/MglB family)
MEQLLAEINAVSGVVGSFVADGEGKVVARALSATFDESDLQLAARTLLQTVEGLETTKRRRVHELDIVFRDSRMLVKNLRPGCLYVVCARNINVPLLDLTANVAARRAAEMLKEAKPAPPGGLAVARARPAKLEEAESPTDPSALLLAKAQEVIAAAAKRAVLVRLLGGAAVKAICPSAVDITLPPENLDLDLAAYGRQRKQLDTITAGLGYEPYRRFNALHGHRRLKYSHPREGVSLDVFVDTFHMCHQLRFENRLEKGELTLPTADLLLSKLQIVQMSEKDLRDIYALLCDHDLGYVGDVEQVDADHVASICSDDWGWYKTVSMNIEKCVELADEFLSQQRKQIAVSRALRLGGIIEAAPKSLRWQARARIGEARRWYDLPEE